jgi:hypothetical protein
MQNVFLNLFPCALRFAINVSLSWTKNDKYNVIQSYHFHRIVYVFHRFISESATKVGVQIIRLLVACRRRRIKYLKRLAFC